MSDFLSARQRTHARAHERLGVQRGRRLTDTSLRRDLWERCHGSGLAHAIRGRARAGADLVSVDLHDHVPDFDHPAQFCHVVVGDDTCHSTASPLSSAAPPPSSSRKAGGM
eukprot:3082440-Rhodomonas_salina.1